jgi:hypothetical protein
LARLDTESLEWQVARSQASLDTAQARLEQAQEPAMSKPEQNMMSTRALQGWYDALASKTEGPAHDFEFRNVKSRNPIQLGDFRGGEPAFLVFGSFT